MLAIMARSADTPPSMRYLLPAVLSLSLVACGGSPPVSGRYYQRGAWIEFGADGSVRHGDSGDTGRFRVEDSRIVISSGPDQIVGKLIGKDTVEFPAGTSSFAAAFAGTWAAPAETAKGTAPPAGSPAAGSPAAGKVDAKALIGEWGAPGDPGNLIFRPDGTFQWGSTVSGTYVLLDAQRIRMSFTHSSKPSGQMENRIVLQGILLRMEMADGSKVVYQRVK
jgi:hypothetical protein